MNMVGAAAAAAERRPLPDDAPRFGARQLIARTSRLLENARAWGSDFAAAKTARNRA
jgi:hypothetical protein